MGIIPKEGEDREPLGVVTVLVLHVIIGLGIATIGQRMKNVTEFWVGMAVFLVIFLVAGYAIYTGTDQIPAIYGPFILFSWIYVILRLIFIAVKKETKLVII